MNTQTTMTRAQLFEVVWKSPLGQVADKLGIRTLDLARICASHRIPRPTSGHWTQTRHGIVFPPPTLEPVNDPRLETIDFSPIQNDGVDTPVRHAIDDEVNAAIIEELNRPPITVPEILQNPHPFVAAVLADDAARAARESKRKRRPTYSDIAKDSAEPRARANVSAPKALKDRAYRVMDTLLKAAEERGFEVLSKPHVYERITLIQILGQVFDVKLYEPSLQKARIPTEEDLAEIAKWGYSLRRKHDYVESGKLCLQLRPEGAGFMYWEIRDTDRATIDSKLKKFFLAALRRVDESRGWQRERDLRDAEKKEFERRQREEEERQRQIEEARKREQARIDALIRDASRWRQSREVREYLIEIRRTCAESGRAIEPGSQLQRWLAWADEIAVQLNPLSHLPAGAGANRKDTP